MISAIEGGVGGISIPGAAGGAGHPPGVPRHAPCRIALRVPDGGAAAGPAPPVPAPPPPPPALPAAAPAPPPAAPAPAPEPAGALT
ncbi:hypothetical protein EHW12_32545 (plasmid) [Rhodococcus sp. NJ-530]|nr:hypothetical protein EHW12_32545 [Rhodococcus sp. NJ-530]